MVLTFKQHLDKRTVVRNKLRDAVEAADNGPKHDEVRVEIDDGENVANERDERMGYKGLTFEVADKLSASKFVILIYVR